VSGPIARRCAASSLIYRGGHSSVLQNLPVKRYMPKQLVSPSLARACPTRLAKHTFGGLAWNIRFAVGLAQKGVTLVQQRGSGIRILEIMIEIIPSHEFVLDARRLQARRHQSRFRDAHIAVKSPVKQEHRHFDLLGIARGRRFFQLRTVAHHLVHNAVI
jgi:hypothetical protein